VNLSHLTRPVRTEAAALAVSGIGIVVQIIGGVNYPAVPPGLIIVLGAAALVAFLPWRWAPLIGILAGGFMVFGGAAASQGRYDLTHPGHLGAFTGTWIEIIAAAVAVIAGVTALLTRRHRQARRGQAREREYTS
jgi:hypothetical protein